MHSRYALAVMLTLCLSACVGTHQVRFASDTRAAPSQQQFDYDLKSVTVARGDEKELTGSVPANFNEMAFVTTPIRIVDLWKQALEARLSDKAFFSTMNPKKLELRVTVLKFDVPLLAALSPETTVESRYELRELKTGKVVFSKVFSEVGSVPMDFAFLGSTRSIESVNRGVTRNIDAFLTDLEKSRF